MKYCLSSLLFLVATISGGRYEGWDDIKHKEATKQRPDGSGSYGVAIFYDGHRLVTTAEPHWTKGHLVEQITQELQRKRAAIAGQFDIRVHPGGSDITSLSPGSDLRSYIFPGSEIIVTPGAGVAAGAGIAGAGVAAGPAAWVPPEIDFYARVLQVKPQEHWSVNHLELAIRDELRKTMKREPPPLSIRIKPGDTSLDSADDKQKEITQFGALKADSPLRPNATIYVTDRRGSTVAAANPAPATPASAAPAAPASTAPAAANSAAPAAANSAAPAAPASTAPAAANSAAPAAANSAAPASPTVT